MAGMRVNGSQSTWAINNRVVLYAAIGAALYAVLNWTTFEILVPGTDNISVRPHYGLVPFFGFAFGPVAGFVTGFVGNVVGDQLTGLGALKSWQWSLANGAAGLLAGIAAALLVGRSMTSRDRAVRSAVVGVATTVVGFLVIFVELITQPELGFNHILTSEYFLVIVGNSVAAAIVTPILVLAWEPLRRELARQDPAR
jgi:energy-coupling factor transport system substrate-specific component